MEQQQQSTLQFIGGVRQFTAGNGETFHKLLLDNPSPANQDGTPNQYYRGSLVWVDKSGNQYTVKQLSITDNLGDRAKEHGFLKSF